MVYFGYITFMGQIKHFIWDKGNSKHLIQAHPHILQETLENMVANAKEFRFVSIDEKTGLKNFVVKQGKLAAVFTLLKYDTARIFSVREF